jgi:hypothetical protein
MSQTIDPEIKAGKQLEVIIRQINEGTIPSQKLGNGEDM